MNKRIWLSSPHMGGNETLYVKNAFDTNWIAPLGPNVDGFEADIDAFMGNEVYSAALSSGTAAIHMALIMLGVSAGDEVICQSLTFSASANPILYQGASPVFVDSEPQTWNMSPELLEQAILARIAAGKLPKAIVVVHLYGMPAKMADIMRIAQRYDIPVIEDAAEALGAELQGKKMGSWGVYGILSFNGNKIITTSGGGALLCATKEEASRARFIASQAREPFPYFQHSKIGYNYRMSNVCAGIGRGQMEVLSLRIYQRRKNFQLYKKLLSNNPGITFQEEPDSTYFSNRWLTAITIEGSANGGEQEELREMLENENIEVRYVWKPMHLQPVFEQYPFYGDGTSEALFKNGLCLPSGSNLTDIQLSKVVKEIKKYFELKVS